MFFGIVGTGEGGVVRDVPSLLFCCLRWGVSLKVEFFVSPGWMRSGTALLC